MGFICEKYDNNQGGLRVIFMGDQNDKDYFVGDSVSDALEYFNMYVKNNQIFYNTEEELSLAEIGINNIYEAEILRQELNDITSSMTDEEASERPFLFPSWKINTNYSIDTRVRYCGRIFKVLQNHTSQEDWTPSRAPSLFAEILTDDSGEPQAWVQPSSTNPYLVGDRVIFNNNIYESIIDNNIWSPADYPGGWVLIEDNSNQEPTISEWMQPDASNPYNTGDRVIYNNLIYESLIDNNTWSPADYPAGWQLISEINEEEEPIETETEEEDHTYPEWAQPEAGNAYNTGDRVVYNGYIYQSTIDNNVWSPETYPAGWQLIE